MLAKSRKMTGLGRRFVPLGIGRGFDVVGVCGWVGMGRSYLALVALSVLIAAKAAASLWAIRRAEQRFLVRSGRKCGENWADERRVRARSQGLVGKVGIILWINSRNLAVSSSRTARSCAMI